MGAATGAPSRPDRRVLIALLCVSPTRTSRPNAPAARRAGMEREIGRPAVARGEVVRAQLPRQGARALDAPPRPLGLQRLSLPGTIQLVGEGHSLLVERYVLPGEPERLALARARLG